MDIDVDGEGALGLKWTEEMVHSHIGNTMDHRWLGACIIDIFQLITLQGRAGLAVSMVASGIRRLWHRGASAESN